MLDKSHQYMMQYSSHLANQIRKNNLAGKYLSNPIMNNHYFTSDSLNVDMGLIGLRECLTLIAVPVTLSVFVKVQMLSFWLLMSPVLAHSVDINTT
jgi:hypothetical protein